MRIGTTLRVIVAAALVDLTVGCGRAERTAAPPALLAPQVQTARTSTVEPGFIGVVVAGEAVEIEPKVEARIEAILVKTGDQVRRGTPLARLDVQASEHELTIARAALTDASRRLARRQRLAKGHAGVVTAEEMETARREVLQERARVEKLSEAHAEATIRAPFDGAIADLYLAAGALAGPHRAVFRLVGRGAPQVRFAVPEDKAATIVVGDDVEVRVAGGGPLRGRVTSVSPEIDSSSRMVYAAADFAGLTDGTALSTGLIARVFRSANEARER
jgi:RND family efflux transporter MFP subunit